MDKLPSLNPEAAGSLAKPSVVLRSPKGASKKVGSNPDLQQEHENKNIEGTVRVPPIATDKALIIFNYLALAPKEDHSGGGGSRQSCGPILEQLEPVTESSGVEAVTPETPDSQRQRKADRLKRRTSLQVSGGSGLASAPPPSPSVMEGVESILLKQFSSPKTSGSPLRSREASGTPPGQSKFDMTQTCLILVLNFPSILARYINM